MKQVLEVLKPGLLTTIQDIGRHGYQAMGFSVCGAMDEEAFKYANILVGNDPNAAAIEVTLLGPHLKVLDNSVMAITGADLGAKINGEEVRLWQAFNVRPGDEISFGGQRSGCRAYIAVSGGIEVPLVMGSRSTYIRAKIGGLEGCVLKTGDVLQRGIANIEPFNLKERKVPDDLIPSYDSKITLRVILGPQDDYFSENGIKTFLSSEYTVTNESDRMGYRLDGPKIEHLKGADIISDGIPLGAIQVPGHGFPIIMLADRQSLGGYAKIATIISSDIPKIAQAKPGDKIRFSAISYDDAVEILKIREEKLIWFKESMSRQYEKSDTFKVVVQGQAFRCRILEL